MPHPTILERIAALVPRGLRPKLTLLVVAATLPGFALAAYAAAEGRRRDRREVQEDAYRLARMTAAAHERTFDSAQQLLLALTQIPAVVDATSERCAGTLRRVLAESPRYLALGRAGDTGSVACSAPGDMRSVADRPWFRAALSAQGFVFGRLEADVAPKPGLVLAYGYAQSGARGVLFGVLDPAWLASLSPVTSLPEATSVNIIDGNGVVVARQPDHAAWVGRDVRATPLVRAALERGDGYAELPGLDGVPRLFGFHRLQNAADANLVTMVGIPLETAFAGSTERLQAALIVVVATAAVVLAATWFGIQHFVLAKIDRLVRAVRRMGANDLTARVGLPPGDDELSELATAFDTMAWNLEGRDAAARQAAESLRALAIRVETVREQERTEIARDIHDQLGQNLTALRMDVEWLTRGLPQAQQTPDVARKLTGMARLLDETVPLVRNISRRLRPGVLDALGLRAAVEWLLEDFERRFGLHTEFICSLDDSRLHPDRATAVFRILQEALTNVLRHAAAQSVTVHLGQDGEWALVEIMDDGRGITAAAAADPKALGLLGMRERAGAVGGRLTIHGKPNAGTIVSIAMPLEPEP